MAKIGRRISSPSIDIAISFNDIEFNSYSVGYMKKYFRDKPISCSEQIVALSRSIQKNWPEMKNNIYALHSKKISNKNFKLFYKRNASCREIIQKIHLNMTYYDYCVADSFHRDNDLHLKLLQINFLFFN